jgi:hypothetical protein
MTPDQANALAIRYKNTWRGGPSVDELRTQLADMDHTTASTVITRLARDLEHPPTIHTMWERYRATRNGERLGIPQPEYTGPPISPDEAAAKGLHPYRSAAAAAAITPHPPTPHQPELEQPF